MVEMHGILLDSEFEDPSFVRRFDILGSRKSERQPWTAYLVRIDSADLIRTIIEVQRNMKTGPWYAHFYENSRVAAVYKDGVFEINHNTNWGPAIEHGRSLGIPDDQLAFHPHDFENEGDYRSV